jgi:hypothetical protein
MKSWIGLERAGISAHAPGRATILGNFDVTAHRIVFANEKGGTGKSTTAVHVAIALAYQGAKVACVDLDHRQRTLFRYMENRLDTEKRRKISLPGTRFAYYDGDSIEELEEIAAGQGRSACPPRCDDGRHAGDAAERQLRRLRPDRAG